MDEKQIKKLQALDDASLREAARAAAQAAGIDARQSERIAKHPEKLRQKLETVTQEELRAMLQSVTPQQLGAIEQALREIDRG
mgnify:FL=1